MTGEPVSVEAGRWSCGRCLAGGQLSSRGWTLSRDEAGPGQAPKTKTWRFPTKRTGLQPGEVIALLLAIPKDVRRLCGHGSITANQLPSNFTQQPSLLLQHGQR